MRVATFSLFLPNTTSSNHPFHDPEAWRNAGIEVIIFARLDMPEANLVRRMRIWEGKGALREYSIPDEQLNSLRYRVSVLPCETDIKVIVNGRTVINDHPQMLLISGWTDFEQPTVIVRTYPRRIPPDTFPKFPKKLQ